MSSLEYLVVTNLDEIINDISLMEMDIDHIIYSALSHFADLMYDKAIDMCGRYNLSGSEFESSISIIPDGKKGISIIVGSEHADYVEYGTGYYGEIGRHHPWAGDESWEYDGSGHGIKGWSYINPKTKKLSWTAGTASRPVIYETWKYGRQHVTQSVQAYINRELRKRGL